MKAKNILSINGTYESAWHAWRQGSLPMPLAGLIIGRDVLLVGGAFFHRANKVWHLYQDHWIPCHWHRALLCNDHFLRKLQCGAFCCVAGMAASGPSGVLQDERG